MLSELQQHINTVSGDHHRLVLSKSFLEGERAAIDDVKAVLFGSPFPPAILMPGEHLFVQNKLSSSFERYVNPSALARYILERVNVPTLHDYTVQTERNNQLDQDQVNGWLKASRKARAEFRASSAAIPPAHRMIYNKCRKRFLTYLSFVAAGVESLTADFFANAACFDQSLARKACLYGFYNDLRPQLGGRFALTTSAEWKAFFTPSYDNPSSFLLDPQQDFRPSAALKAFVRFVADRIDDDAVSSLVALQLSPTATAVEAHRNAWIKGLKDQRKKMPFDPHRNYQQALTLSRIRVS